VVTLCTTRFNIQQFYILHFTAGCVHAVLVLRKSWNLTSFWICAAWSGPSAPTVQEELWLDCWSLADGTDSLPLNVGTQPPLHSAQNRKTAKTAFRSRRKLEVKQRAAVVCTCGVKLRHLCGGGTHLLRAAHWALKIQNLTFRGQRSVI